MRHALSSNKLMPDYARTALAANEVIGRRVQLLAQSGPFSPVAAWETARMVGEKWLAFSSAYAGTASVLMQWQWKQAAIVQQHWMAGGLTLVPWLNGVRANRSAPALMQRLATSGLAEGARAAAVALAPIRSAVTANRKRLSKERKRR